MVTENDDQQEAQRTGLEIAVIGMAGSFPGANSLTAFWQNLAEGVDAIAHFSTEELLEQGIDPSLLNRPNYIKAKGFLEDIEYFDADFFHYSKREAEILDPQIRLLHECGWEALEQAGYVPQTYSGPIGLFAGASTNYEWMERSPLGQGAQGAAFIEAGTLCYKDSLSTLTAYKLGLKGPSITLYTACSTSLLAIHLACRALLTGECDLALAGGVRVSYPKKSGYLYEVSMTASPDGRTRPFDASAAGAVFGDGAGVVLLKRLEEALQDGDTIQAIVKGSAANNDGARKVGYTAPSIEGQYEVITAALNVAEVAPEAISYVETHGTATPLGDTIEFEALKRAFLTDKKSYCAIGSVKSNVGHIDTAAGVTGFIKTVLALQHRQIPPSLHFDHPNPKIDFVNSPFYVNTELSEWTANGPRRAGVSSFGYGGTNVHVILEEAPQPLSAASERAYHLVTLAARTPTALARMAGNLSHFLQTHPETSLADMAYTLHVGRQHFPWRQAVVCSSLEEARADAERLSQQAASQVWTTSGREHELLLRLGTADVGSSTALRDLYQQEPLVREDIELCLRLIGTLFGAQVRRSLSNPVEDTPLTAPARFCLGFIWKYVLARALITLGLRPVSIAAQGLALLPAACLSQVLSLEEALRWGQAALQFAAAPTDQHCRQNLVSLVRETRLQKPVFPLLSEETGAYLSDDATQKASTWLRLLDPASDSEGHATSSVLDRSVSLLVQIGEGDVPQDIRQMTGPEAVVRLFPQEDTPAGQHFLSVLAELWMRGVLLDWKQLYAHESRHRISLPTYPFEKQRFWIDSPNRRISRPPSQIEKRADLASWFYKPIWKAQRTEEKAVAPATWLVFQDCEQFGELLATRLQALGHRLMIVEPAAAFAQLDELRYAIRPTETDDYHRVLDAIGEVPWLGVLHLWTIGQNHSEESLLECGFYSLLHLTKALARQDSRQEVEITVLTDQLYAVSEAERIVPEKALLLAPVKVIPQEHSYVTCRCIDIDPAEARTEHGLMVLLEEVAGHITETELAMRGSHRYVQTYETLPAARIQPTLALPTDVAVPPLRQGGVYLITGGLGSIGLKLGGYLARTLKARLVLVGRSGVPLRENWPDWLASHDSEDRTSFRIRQIQQLEAAGAQVLVAAADVADEEQMRQVLLQVERTFGTLNGVIHAAGILRVHSAQCPIATITQAECKEQLRPKLQGVKVLHHLLASYELDFCLLVSSLSPILGGLGFVAYAAANLYMDAFVLNQRRTGGSRWIGVNWGDWQYLGPKFQKRISRTAIDALEMTTEEALKTFQCILSLEEIPQIVVSSGDLLARIEQWIELKPMREQQVPPLGADRAGQRTLQGSMYQVGQLEQVLAEVWQEFYRIQDVDHHTNFFELGATSLDIIQIHTRLVNLLQRHIPIEVMFEHPTIAQLALALSDEDRPRHDEASSEAWTRRSATSRRDIAVIGMAGRFPGANSIEEFWQNLVNRVESIRFFEESELEEAGVSRAELRNPNYRRAKGYLEGTDYFDASFFDYTPRDAQLMDPQLRVFHECAWSALENAGYNVRNYDGKVGVFAGASPNLYWQVLSMLFEKDEPAGLFLTSLLNDKDSLSTQISYKFHLHGPSINVFTGCSTSLVAIDYACQSLQNGQCDLALVGGITITQPEKAGYMYQEGMLFSADGHCRAFDKAASGMVFGDGVGVVILKPLDDALADGDTIHAVIKGTAINNDGHRKIGYTAPSIDGQAEVITAALVRAGVEPESIGYIETHGTATQLGDVIEVAALKKVFGRSSGECYPIGSVKTNVGHLNAASGVTGFIKTVLALEKRLLPPSLHCETPNPQIDFGDGLFYVNRTLQLWQREDGPLRAGVSSFGIGGTNAHVILEEAPCMASSDQNEGWKLLLLSARSQAALERMTDHLAQYFSEHPDCNLADAAYTLQVGRQAFEYRRTLVCRDTREAAELLARGAVQLRTAQVEAAPNVVFLFPGNGAQYVHMARELYDTLPGFHAELNACFDLLRTLHGIDLTSVLYPVPTDEQAEAQAKQQLRSMEYSQPMIFCLEYALARLLIGWGIQPSAMIGYSFGEYTAACLAGVFSLRDALQLVLVRGRLMSELSEGAMLSVPRPEAATVDLLQEFRHLANGTSSQEVAELAVAIDNGASCIVAGSPRAIADFEHFLRMKRLLSMRVVSDVAAHSSQLEAVATRFADHVRSLSLHAPGIPFISGITGTWITDAQAQDPHYWVSHMRETIRFAAGIEELTKNTRTCFLEVGPGRDLSVLLQRFFEQQNQRVQQTIRPSYQDGSDRQFLFESLAALWRQGVTINWQAFAAGERRCRIPLPTYSFERVSYKRQGNPFELASRSLPAKSQAEEITKLSDPTRWFYVPRWRSTVIPALPSSMEPRVWLIFEDERQIAAGLAEQLRERGQRVVTVRPGSSFVRVGDACYQLTISDQTQYYQLFDDLRQQNGLPDSILHCTSLTAVTPQEQNLDSGLQEGFYSLLFVLQALARQPLKERLDIRVITSGAQSVIGDEPLIPAHACLIGPGIVISQEIPYVRCSVIDAVVPEGEGGPAKRLWKQLLSECLTELGDHLVAYRGNHRWVCEYQPLPLDEAAPKAVPLRQRGVYLITGAFGGIGKILCRHLAETYQAKLALISRHALPERDRWERLDANSGDDERVRFLQELEALGTQVVAVSADCADLSAMAAAITEVERRLGSINGVIHAAGLVGDETFQMLRDLTVSDCEKQFQAKVRGVLVLQKLLREKQLDFCLLMSSIATVLGGLGYGAYSAANLFMDAFVHEQVRHSSLPWYVVDWSDWKYWHEEEKQGAIGQSVHKLSMEPEEGIDALKRVLTSDERHIIHSPGQLDLRLRQWVKLQEVQQESDVVGQGQRHPRPDLPSPYSAPSNHVETTLADIWASAFKVEKVGIHDDFFELGGDSLKGITVVSRIHKELYVEVPVAELFQTSTIAALATYIEHIQNKEWYAIPMAPVKPYYRLSSAQKRLYILNQLHPESTAYNDVMAYVLEGELDAVRFEQTLQRLIARHESFRTSFEIYDGEPVQKIHPSVTFKLLYQETTEEEARDLVGHFIRPFDLSQAPLIRAALLRLASNRHILVLDIHHIITDGVSYDCFVHDCITLYLGGALPPLRLQYKDYAEWQYSEQARALVAQQEAYWLEKFAGPLAKGEMRTDYPRPEVQDFSGERLDFALGEDVTRQVKQAALTSGTTVYVYLLSILTILLFKYTGADDLIIGSPVTGRSHPDLEGIIGMFVNMLPIRTSLEPTRRFQEYLRALHQTVFEAFEHDKYQYDELIMKLGLHGSIQRNPLFNVVFVLQNMNTEQLHVGDLRVDAYRFTPHRAAFDLVVSAVEVSENLLMSVEYARSLFRRETITGLISHYLDILHKVLAHPERQLQDVLISHGMQVLEDHSSVLAGEDFAF